LKLSLIVELNNSTIANIVVNDSLLVIPASCKKMLHYASSTGGKTKHGFKAIFPDLAVVETTDKAIQLR
jgi:hypothetical protein